MTRGAYARGNKYGNVKTRVDGHTFASKREATRYGELRLLEKAGELTDLELQPKYPCAINGVHVCNYTADFRYVLPNGQKVVEDSKGKRTTAYMLKKKIVRAVHGIEIVEV